MKKSAKGRAGARGTSADEAARASKKKTASAGARAKKASARPKAAKAASRGAEARKAPAKKKPAAKKAPAKKAPPKKASAKKASAKNAPPKKASAKKASAKNAPPKKAAAKKPAAKKPAAKTPAAKTPAAKTPAATTPAKAITAPTAREAHPDALLVEQTIELLDSHDQRVGESMREIGEHLLERYFGGDEELARSRLPTKPRSYEHLAKRAELETSWDAADLQRAVTAALVYRSLPSNIAERLPPSYLPRLDAIDDASRRDELAARIAAGELRGTAAKEAITQASLAIRRGGPHRVPGPIRLANGLERLLDRADDFHGLDASAVHGLDELARAALAGRIDDVARRLSAVAARIRAGR